MAWQLTSSLSTSSQVQEAEYWPTYFSDIAPSVLSKSIDTTEIECYYDRKTPSCPDSQCGTMCEPLGVTTQNAPGSSMPTAQSETNSLSAEDSPAKIFPLPAKEQASMESEAGYGLSMQESFARFDRATSSWRTPQCSLLEGMDVFSATWPQQGIMLHGVCYRRQTVGPHKNAREYGLWPTPTVCGNYNRKGASKTSGDGLATALGGTPNPLWVEWLMGWPIGWAEMKPLAMDKFLSWRQAHFPNSTTP